jgi:hypothetical protein
MPDISFVDVPIPDHAFFEKPEFQSLFGNDFLQVTRFTAQGRYLIFIPLTVITMKQKSSLMQSR